MRTALRIPTSWFAFGALALALAASSTGCGGEPPRRRPSPTPHAAVAAGEELFFPAGTLGRNTAESDLWARRRYSRLLTSLGESPLGEQGETGGEIYRLLWASSLYLPVVVRAGTGDDGPSLIVRQQDLEPGTNRRLAGPTSQRELTAAEWDSLRGAIDKSGFWTMSSAWHPVQDSSSWIVEGRRDGRYHVVSVSSPDGAFRQACIQMLRAGGITLPDEHIY